MREREGDATEEKYVEEVRDRVAAEAKEQARERDRAAVVDTSSLGHKLVSTAAGEEDDAENEIRMDENVGSQSQDNQDNFECQVLACESAFSFEDNLIKHMKDVHGEAGFECNKMDCEEVFSSKENMKIHVRKHHEGSGEEVPLVQEALGRKQDSSLLDVVMEGDDASQDGNRSRSQEHKAGVEALAEKKPQNL